jgi:hypothetical protein
MTNAFQVSSLIAKDTTEFFIQKSPIINSGNRQYLEEFDQKNYATGGAINVKVPGYPAVQMGLSVTPTGIQDLIIPYVITPDNDLYNVVRELNLFEQRFDILGGDGALTKPMKQAIVDNYAYPAYLSLEGQLETSAAYRLKTTAYLSPIDTIAKLGSLNTYSAISQIDTMAEAMKFANERYLMMNLTDSQLVTDSLQNMFNQMINGNITKTARVGGPDKGRLAGFDVYRSTQLIPHVAGPLALETGITVTNVASDGTTITLSGVGSSTGVLINAGDRISLPNTFLLAPITFDVLGYRLVVTAAAAANGDGAGNVVVTLSYPLMASGEHANVAALPSNGAPAIVFPNYNLNFAYVRSGLSVVPVSLGDIHGATNSETRANNKVPVKTVIQGAVEEFTNVYRTSLMCGIRPFAPYVITIPSLA